MNFELKKIEIIGGVKPKDSDNSMQLLNIFIGVVGCPYTDIIANKIVEYTFSNTMSVQAVKDGINTFANNWIADNYPAIS